MKNNGNFQFIDLIILAGGLGSRLLSVSKGTPKALMPIGESVYLDLLLEKIFKNNIKNVYLSLHYKPELFHNYINNSIFKKRLKAITEPKPLGTGGAINYVVESTNISPTFFVTNGDSMSDINLNKMYEEFLGQKLTAMIGISKVDNSERYGTILQKNGKVISFIEKGNLCPGWINNGHYIFKKEAFAGFSGAFSLEKNLFPKLVKNQELGAFKVENDNFIDMGIPEDYEKLRKMYEASK